MRFVLNNFCYISQFYLGERTTSQVCVTCELIINLLIINSWISKYKNFGEIFSQRFVVCAFID